MPSSGYSELANWDGTQSGTRPKPQDSGRNTSFKSTANEKNRAEPAGLPAESTPMELSRSQPVVGLKYAVVETVSASQKRADIFLSTPSMDTPSARKNLYQDSIVDGGRGQTSIAPHKTARQISHPEVPVSSASSVGHTHLSANGIIDRSSGRWASTPMNSQVNEGIPAKSVAIRSNGVPNEEEISSEITMTDNDAEGSTDEGYLDEEDDRSVFVMLTSSSPQQSVSLFTSQSELAPPSGPNCTTSPPFARLSQPLSRRQFMSHVMVPPLPHGARKSDWSRVPRAQSNGKMSERNHGNDAIIVKAKHRNGVSGFASVHDALNASLGNDRRSDPSGSLKRKYSTQDKGKARALNDNNNHDLALKSKKPRYHAPDIKLESSTSSGPVDEPKAFSGDCLISFAISIDDLPVPSHSCLASSLRHLLSPHHQRARSNEAETSNSGYEYIPLTGTTRWFLAPFDDDELDDGLEAILLESTSMAPKPIAPTSIAPRKRGRPPKNRKAQNQSPGSVNLPPPLSASAGTGSGLFQDEILDLGGSHVIHTPPRSPVSNTKRKAIARISKPYPLPQRTASPKLDVDLDMDQYFNGLGDHPSTSASVSQSQSSATPSNAKATSNLDLSPTGRRNSATNTNSTTLLDFSHGTNDNNFYPDIHSGQHISNDGHTQMDVSLNNVMQDRGVETGKGLVISPISGRHQTSVLSPTGVDAGPGTALVSVDDQLASGHEAELGCDTTHTSDGIEPWALSGSDLSPILPEEGSSPEYAGDGTIDPSLLGGVVLPQPSSPSPLSSRSPSPSALVTSLKRTALPSEKLKAQSRFSGSQFAPSSIASSSTVPESSKRVTRPRTRPDYVATDQLHLLPNRDSETQAVMTSRPESMEEEEYAYCHQCRRKTNRKKMKCAAIRPKGDPCPRLWCWKCMEDRYPDIPFDYDKRDFTCPACANTCNCTACCAKRGETYVSTRARGRGGMPGRGRTQVNTRLKGAEPQRRKAETTVLRTQVNTRRKGAEPQRRKTETTIPLSSYFSGAPTTGMTYWATVYSLTGEKVATAFDDGNDGVVVARPTLPAGGGSSGNRRVFVGRAQDWWGPGSGDKVNRQLEELSNSGDVGKGKGRASGPSVRTFIGRSGPLFPPRIAASSTSSLSPPMDSPSSPSVEDALEYFDYSQLDDGGEYGQWVDHDDFGLQDNWPPIDGSMLSPLGLNPIETVKGIHAALSALEDYSSGTDYS